MVPWSPFSTQDQTLYSMKEKFHPCIAAFFVFSWACFLHSIANTNLWSCVRIVTPVHSIFFSLLQFTFAFCFHNGNSFDYCTYSTRRKWWIWLLNVNSKAPRKLKRLGLVLRLILAGVTLYNLIERFTLVFLLGFPSMFFLSLVIS